MGMETEQRQGRTGTGAGTGLAELPVAWGQERWLIVTMSQSLHIPLSRFNDRQWEISSPSPGTKQEPPPRESAALSPPGARACAGALSPICPVPPSPTDPSGPSWLFPQLQRAPPLPPWPAVPGAPHQAVLGAPHAVTTPSSGWGCLGSQGAALGKVVWPKCCPMGRVGVTGQEGSAAPPSPPSSHARG